MYFLIFSALTVALGFMAEILTRISIKIDEEHEGGKAFILSVAYLLTSMFCSLAAIASYATAVASIIRIKF